MAIISTWWDVETADLIIQSTIPPIPRKALYYSVQCLCYVCVRHCVKLQIQVWNVHMGCAQHRYADHTPPPLPWLEMHVAAAASWV